MALVEFGECAALLSQSIQQRSRFPELAMLPVELRNAFEDLIQPRGVGVPHWPSAISWKPVAIQVNDVDVDGTQGDALLEDAPALVHERQNAPIHDLFRRDLALWDTSFGSPLAHQVGDFGIRMRAPVLVVLVPAGAALLAITSHFAQPVFAKRLPRAWFVQMPIFVGDPPLSYQATPI